MNNMFNPQNSMMVSNWNVSYDPLSFMPNPCEVIGQVSPKDQDTIVWDGSSSFQLRMTARTGFCSPAIDLAGTRWCLVIEPSCSPPVFRLALRRYDARLDVCWKTFQYKVVVKTADEREQVYSRVIQHFDGKHLICMMSMYMARILNITLRLREVGAVSQGPSYATFKSCKRKAEVFDVESGQVIEDESDDCKCSEGVKLLLKDLNDYLEKRDDCDVRFQVQDKEFPVHSFILKARCPVFCMMLTHDSQEKKSGIIRIEDCDADAFGIFLVYLYTGKVKGLTPEKALDLYYIADKYDFPDLKEKCVAFLKRFLSKTTLCDAVLLSTKHDDSELLKVATNFFVQNVKEIIGTAEWQNFMTNHPTEANKLYTKYVNMSVLPGSMGNYGPYSMFLNKTN